MKPILFNTEMVLAILAGRKTVTRRAVKPQPKEGQRIEYHEARKEWIYMRGWALVDGVCRMPYRPGDILYVRETWAAWSPTYGTAPKIIYKADGYSQSHKMKWRPSIHMPREAARIFLRVMDVRVERLQKITEEQAEKEGCTAHGGNLALDEFEEIWHKTLKPADRALYGWDANPWAWVIAFERCEKPEEV